MADWHVIEVDLGGVNYHPLSYSPSKDQAEKTAAYFRPMQGFSGKDIRVRQYGRPAVSSQQDGKQ